MRPKLAYGSLTWAKAITGGQQAKMHRLHNLVLLSLTRPLRSTPPKGMKVAVGLLLLDLFKDYI